MRMTTLRVVFGVLMTALGTLLLLGIAAGPASATPVGRVHVVGSHVSSVIVRGAVTPVVGGRSAHLSAVPVTAPPTAGTDYNQAQQAADAALVRHKLILGGVSVLLLVIVYFGHRAKYKHVLSIRNPK
jgi:hypothetical protein